MRLSKSNLEHHEKESGSEVAHAIDAQSLLPAEAVAGVAIFPNFNAEQRAKGLTDFNDLAMQNPEVLSQQISSTKTFEARLIAHSLAAAKDCGIDTIRTNRKAVGQ